jgi:hypothetical protein
MGNRRRARGAPIEAIEEGGWGWEDGLDSSYAKNVIRHPRLAGWFNERFAETS